MLCVYAFTGIFIGMHNTAAAFVMQLILNISNVLLDLLFVLGFDWGVEGVALASVIAEYLAMLAGFYLLRHPIRNALERYDRARLLERSALIASVYRQQQYFRAYLVPAVCVQLFHRQKCGAG